MFKKFATPFHWSLFANAFVVAGSLALGCSTNKPVAPEARPLKVTVATAIEQEIIDFDDFVGRTEAFETVEVRSRVSGFIKSVDFKDGSRAIKEKDLLFRIEPDLYKAIHEQSTSRVILWEAKRDLAQSKFARSKLLLPTGAISREEYDESDAAVKESEAAVVAAIADAKRTKLDVEYTEVRAEIAGRIDRAFITTGNMVTGGLGSGTLLTRIVRNDPMFAYLDIDERSVLKYWRRLTASTAPSATKDADTTLPPYDSSEEKERKPIEIDCFLQLADEKDFPHAGKINFAENRVDSATGSIKVRAVFENADSMLTGGLFVRIRVPSPESYRAVLIPEQAIGTDQSIKFAYVVGADNIPQRKSLDLGPQRGAMRVVRSGIEANQKVIYRGLQLVRPGKAVEPELVELNVQTVASGTNPATVVSSNLGETTAVSPVAKTNP